MNEIKQESKYARKKRLSRMQPGRGEPIISVSQDDEILGEIRREGRTRYINTTLGARVEITELTGPIFKVIYTGPNNEVTPTICSLQSQIDENGSRLKHLEFLLKIEGDDVKSSPKFWLGQQKPNDDTLVRYAGKLYAHQSQ